MALYLALDVGGTKTACALGDDERVLARVLGGSIKTLRVASGEARVNLEAMLLQLVSSTGADLRQVRRTCIGTSGASAPGVRAWMKQAVEETIGSELVLMGDEVIALDAAFPCGRGVLAIGGTGSNVVGRAATGQMAHAGGWGPMLADEGSGYWIGQHALRACFRAIDAGLPSTADFVSGGGRQVAGEFFAKPNLADLPALLRRFLEVLDLSGLDQVIGVANAPEFRFAQLVPVVVDAARNGDLLAATILAEAGAGLALLVTRAIEKIAHLESHLAGHEPSYLGTPEVAYIGGVLTHIPEVRDAMLAALEARYPDLLLHPEPVDALAGALWHARGCP